jgi:uncharacterized protein YcfL
MGEQEQQRQQLQLLEDGFFVHNNHPVEPVELDRDIDFASLGIASTPMDATKVHCFSTSDNEKNRSFLNEQIVYWFDDIGLDQTTRINSVVIKLFPPSESSPSTKIGLFKLQGTTAGMNIFLNCIEAHKLCLILIKAINLSWVEIHGGEDELKKQDVKSDHSTFEQILASHPEKIKYKFHNFEAAGVTTDAVVLKQQVRRPDIQWPSLVRLANRLKRGQDWMEWVRLPSFRVVKFKVDDRYFYGIEKLSGRSFSQMIYFSVFEAQWMVVKLCDVIKSIVELKKTTKT